MVLTVLFGCLRSRLQKKKVEEDSTNNVALLFCTEVCVRLVLLVGDFVTIHQVELSGDFRENVTVCDIV